MRLSMIVAMAENRIIGRDGGMPWHLSADLKYFKRVTMGAPVIMGRKTYESIGRALPGRTNIIVTRDRTFVRDGIEVVHDLSDAIRQAETIATGENKDEIFVIGGAQIYDQALSRADRLYITEIHQTCDGDAAFPEFSKSDWRETARENHEPEAENGPAFSFVVWERNS